MNVINYNVMKNKQSYSAPEAEVLVVKFEENILSEINQTNQTEYIRGYNGDVDEL